MNPQRLSESQALFIATLPNVYCDLEYAIRSHSFSQHVAAVTLVFAREAAEIGRALGYVEFNAKEEIRLARFLQKTRDKLTRTELYPELAEYELSRILLQENDASGITQRPT